MGSVNTELDTEKIKPFHKLEGPPDINSATFNSEGNKVLVRSSSTAKLWDTATGKLIREFKGYTSTIISAMFNSTGDKMLICSSGSVLKTTDSYDSDTTIQIWDTETGRLLHNFKGCTSALTVALLAPEGDKVLTASVDGTVIMWLFN
jgi:WD40 repeat protein